MLFFLIVLFAAAAQGQQRSPAATPPPPVLCGLVPSSIISCLGNPRLMSTEASAQCTAKSECERLTCLFERSGWLKAGRVDSEAVRSYFSEYGASHPAWRAATERVRADCLSSTAPLPAQGVHLNCPAYDVLHCAMTAFYRNAPAEVWRGGAQCAAARAFAQVCPICPEDCFASAVPTGSCNACRLLPRSP